MTTTLDAAKQGFYHELLRQMLLIRVFEEQAGAAYAQGKVGGFCHLYIGQEAVAVGSIAALRESDTVIAAYREHGHALARGVAPRAVMAELYGKLGGCSKGKGGSMHLFDASRNFLGGHGIVGSHIPLAAGTAFASKYQGKDDVSACFFGEAAVNIGAFHETLNMAALWKLPVVFVVENNRYGMGTALERASAVWNVYERARSYDMDEELVDGMDVLAVHDVMTRSVARARESNAPTLIEARTYRYMGHSMADPIHGHYRTKEELEEQKSRDPIDGLRAKLMDAELISDESFASMRAAVEEQVQDALAFADENEDPPLDNLFTHVYTD
ncbi:MAG: pyruvate dehydrogenase (acetyl-transferring) E1 component subunit alpha [Gemmatimonadales bacterium]